MTLTLPATSPASPLPVTLPTSAPTPQPVLADCTLQAKRVILPVSTQRAPSILPTFWAEAGSTSSLCWKASSARSSWSRSRSTSRIFPFDFSMISVVKRSRSTSDMLPELEDQPPQA